MKTIILLLLVILFNSTFNNRSVALIKVTPNLRTYTTLNAAFNAINIGVHTNGAIKVTITANVTEIYQARLNGGVFTSCTIMPSANVIITSIMDAPVIFLNGADNVIIDGRIGGVGSASSLTISNYRNNASNAGCVSFNNGASNNILRYVNCKMSSVLTTAARPIVIDQSSPGTAGNKNNIIEFCNTQGGRTGIKCEGTGGNYPFTNDNNIIRNNRVKNAYWFGIILGSFVNNITCENNEIFFDSAVATWTEFMGIAIASAGNVKIRNNKLYNFNMAEGINTSFIGIFLCPHDMHEPIPVTNVDIVNNSISLSSNTTAGKGIDGIVNHFSNDTTMQWLPYTANIYNNTILIEGTTLSGFSVNTVCIYSSYVPGPLTNNYVINSFNNITINRRDGGGTGSSNIGIFKDNVNPHFTINSDYNFCYASNPINGYAMVYGGSYYENSDLELFQSQTCELGIEQHTVFKDVNFVSPTDLHLAGPIGGDMCGTPIGSVATDIDGTIRNSLYPYKGCDEGASFKILTLGAKLQGVASSGEIAVSLINNSCQTVATATGNLSSGSAIFCFGDSVSNGTGYYIDVQTKNHLETYSAALQTFTGNALNYDFKTSSSQAYGSNMILDGSDYAFYGGDINRDGIIDGTDGALIDNDATNFTVGCNLTTDINDDGIVDGSDAVIQNNNAFKFISLNTPCL